MRITSHTSHQPTRDKNEIFENNRKESEWTRNVPSIPEFYANQEIFVTGGSGFLGKVLIEKLLRSCSELKSIYILLRPKKAKPIEQRLKEILELPLFDPIKSYKPELFQKLIPIAGDVAAKNLGLSTVDVNQMKNVSIIFHSAASVRFDDSLKDAVFMNTRGTYEIMNFAKTLKNIKVIMHVSTTYSHPELKVVDERIHEPYVDWRKTIQICETMDDNLINTLTELYSGFMPNTYTFTKALAEQVVDDHKDELPLTLFRPSIVISAMKEPLSGWLDNFNGPVGMLIGSGLGITRTMYCDPENIADFTPVDVCIKAMIIGAWKRAHESSGLPVINCCLSNYRNATIEQIIEMGKAFQCEIPLGQMLWAPGGSLTRCRYSNYIKVIFLHIIPAMFIDQLLKLSGRKPFLVKLQRKIYQANLALHYFILNNWHFKNDNFMDLCSHLKDKDLKAFNFHDFLEFDLVLYFSHAVAGGRKYLLGEKDEDIPRDKKKYFRMKMMDRILKIIAYGICFWYIFVRYDIFGISGMYCSLIHRYHSNINC